MRRTTLVDFPTGKVTGVITFWDDVSCLARYDNKVYIGFEVTKIKGEPGAEVGDFFAAAFVDNGGTENRDEWSGGTLAVLDDPGE